MPDLEWNRDMWDESYEWPQDGHEWSAQWGSSSILWHGVLAPRLGDLLPTGSIVEIAPGRGRWTSYLLDRCFDFTGYDIAESCTSYCRENLSSVGKAVSRQFETTDGTSLPSTPALRTDLVFSFDSLVHVNKATLDAYFSEISRVLRPGGHAFLHFSNLGDPNRGIPTKTGLRDPDVSAQWASEAAREQGLRMLVGEKVSWAGYNALDCIGLFRKDESPPESWQPTVFVDNDQFWSDAQGLRSTIGPHLDALR